MKHKVLPRCARALAISSLLFSSVVLTSCEDEQDVKVASAQECLDYANSTNVDTCTAMVSGLESPIAYKIRCSAHYIAQGFTGARFASAFEKIKNNTAGGTDPMAAAMSYLTFTAKTGTHGSDNTLEDCKKSGVVALIRLATVTSMGTLIATSTAGGGITFSDGVTEEELTTALNNIKNSGGATDKESLGTLAITASENFCQAGSQFADNAICKNVQNAIVTGNGDATAIGTELLNQLLAN